MAAAKYNEALAYLQKTSSEDGTSVYEHLTSMLMKVLEEKPTKAVDLLETSLLVKKTAFEYKESSPLVPVTSAADAARAVTQANLFGNPDLPIDPESGEPIEADSPNEFECEDALKDGVLLDLLGVGLGRQEAYNVMLAVRKLGEDPVRGIATIRFFGKFFGLYADYYVFETTLQSMPEEEEQPESGEATELNSGANANVYFVSNYLGGPVTQLPSVKPAQIKAARKLKKFLTGRLTSPVSTFPVFPGNEANYLRAQIARIAHTTVCAPAGLFEADEDGNLEKVEDWTPVENGRDMALASNWCHRLPYIFKQARCKLFVREEPEDEEELEKFELTEEEQEEGPEPLRLLEEDAPVVGGASAWTPLYSSSNENVKNQVSGMRSNLWPGAVVAAQGMHFCSTYVGWGIKYETFVPQPPPPVAKEFDQKQVESMELPPKPKAPEEGEEEEED